MLRYNDIPYSARPEPNLCVDVAVPDECPCRATLVWLHGGGLEHGNRHLQEDWAQVLCNYGIGVVSVEYRMYPDAQFPDFIVDCAEAVRWTVDHAVGYGLSENILIGGSSAGGYLSMMLCFDRQYLAAFELEPEDMCGYLLDAGQPTTHYNVLKYRGTDSRRLIVDEAGPLFHIQDARPDRPLLITVSDNDIPARLEQNQLLCATLRHFEYDMSKVEMHVMKGFTHCGYTNAKDESGRMIYVELVKEFLDRHAIG